MLDVVWWRMKSGVLLASYLARYLDGALERDHDTCHANAVVLRRRIPWGAESWGRTPEGPWEPLETLPADVRAALTPLDVKPPGRVAGVRGGPPATGSARRIC